MEIAKYKTLPPDIDKRQIKEFLISLGYTNIKYSGGSGMFYYTNENGKEQEHGKDYLIKLINKKKEEINE